MSKSRLLVRNNSTNRIIIGPRPKSQGGRNKDAIRFGTAADAPVPDGKRLGQVHTIEGERAEALRKSPVVKAVASKLGLQIG